MIRMGVWQRGQEWAEVTEALIAPGAGEAEVLRNWN